VLVGEGAAVHLADDEVGRGMGVPWGIDQHVPRVDGRTGEFVVHLLSRGLVGETVIGACSHAFEANLDGWQQNHVLETREPCGFSERLEEPWPDNAVVHHHVPTVGVPAYCRCGRLGHDRVLVVRLRQPRRNRALGHESEEGVAVNEHTLVEPFGDDSGDGRLAGSRWTSDDQQRTHTSILARRERLPPRFRTPPRRFGVSDDRNTVDFNAKAGEGVERRRLSGGSATYCERFGRDGMRVSHM